MVNCTKHSIIRWVERIVGILTQKERDEYIRDNEKQIRENMNTTLSFAEFIYKGQIGDNVTRNYYIQKDIIFVLNTTDDAIITVYKVDFNFPRELNLNVAKELVTEIHKLVAQKEDIEFKMLEEVEKKENQSKQVEEQIKIMREQLKVLENDKKFIDDSIKNIKNKSKVTDLEIKKYTNMLVNSKEYREDLKSM